MSWIVCEGIDRSGKSTVAEFYRGKGYEVIHLSAPDKKYSVPGYTGPSYLDDLLEQVLSMSGKDVVWDRSWYGETVWSHVYSRTPQLIPEEIEIFREIEDQNQTRRILMIDTNLDAHWKRCVDNKESLTKPQFIQAKRQYDAMAHKYNFEIKQLSDFVEKPNVTDNTGDDKVDPVAPTAPADTAALAVVEDKKFAQTAEQIKLGRANAINKILSKPILKTDGPVYDQLEKEIRSFLNDRLGELFSGKNTQVLSQEDVAVVKEFVKILKEKKKG